MKLSTFLLIAALDGVLALCSGCAFYQAHKTQVAAVSKVALEHVARDVKAVAASALINQAQSGFNGDWAASAAQGAYMLTPTILSSGNLQDYLDAWNPAAPAVNAQIAKSVSTALPGDQVAAALKNPVAAQALASEVGVTIGNAILAEAQRSATASK